MSTYRSPTRQIAAPKATRVLAEILAIGILGQATFAGGFLGGHHTWLAWHQHVGDLLPVIPLAGLIIGIALRRRSNERPSMLVARAVLLIVVAGTEATGHAGGSLLALHIPLAVATMGLTVWQILVSTRH